LAINSLLTCGEMLVRMFRRRQTESKIVERGDAVGFGPHATAPGRQDERRPTRYRLCRPAYPDRFPTNSARRIDARRRNRRIDIFDGVAAAAPV
jgi:hypothetical protein